MNAETMSETKVCDKPAMRDLAEGVLALLGDDCFLVLNERNNENSRLKMKQSIAHAMTKGNVCHDGMKGIFVQPHCDDAKECLFLRFVGEPYVIDIDSSRRAIVCKVRASGLTGLQLEYHEPSAPATAPQQAALNSLRVRYAPTMLYPPARAAFEAALNSKAKKPGFVGTESRSVYAEATPLRNSGESELPLNESELAALRALGGGIDPAQVAADAELAAREMMAGLRGKQSRRREVARNADTANGEHDCRATKIPCPLQSNSLNNEETREKIKGLAPVEIGYSEEKRTGAQWAEEAKSYFLTHFAGRQMTIGQTDYMLHIPNSENKAKQATTGVNTQKRTEAFKNLQGVIDNAVHLKSEDAKNKPAQSKKKQALLARTATFETFGYPATINGEKNLIWFNAITKKHGDRDVLFYEFGCTPIDKD